MIDSRSRWLVGSSSSSASGRISRMRASATRIFQPPESAPTSPSIISWLKPRPGEDLARPRLERVAAELLEARLHLAEALDELVHLVGAVRDRPARPRARASSAATASTGPGAVHRLGDDAAARHLADVLAEVADGDAAIDRDLAVVGLLLAGDQPEDGRLAGAVGADEADLLAAVDRRRGLEEEDLLAVLLADVVETDHVRSGRL